MSTTPGIKLLGETIITTSDGRPIKGVFLKVTKEIPPGYSVATVRAKNAARDCDVLTDDKGTILSFINRKNANRFMNKRKI